MFLAVLYNSAEQHSPRPGATSSQKPSQATLPAATKTGCSELENGSNTNKPTDEPKSVRVILPPKDIYDRASFWVSAVLATVGIIGIFVAVGTLCYIRHQVREMRHQGTLMKGTLSAIRRQTRHMEGQVEEMKCQTGKLGESISVAREAANAALLNAQAVINSERGRLLFEVEKRQDEEIRGVGIFKIFAVNYGRSPAEVLGYAPFTEDIVNSTDDLLVPPQYQAGIAPIKRFLAQGEKCLVAEASPARLGRGLNAAAMKLAAETGISINDQRRIVYGEIRYMDGISEKARFSRYCFRLERVPFSNIGGSLVPCGPKEYNDCT